MKKHADTLAQIKSEDLAKTADQIRNDLMVLKKGIRMGDVQNFNQLSAKRKELARVFTRMNQERKAK